METRKEIEPFGSPSVGSQPRVPAIMEQVTNCGYCHCRVSPDRESFRKHVLNCVGHPAHALAEALKDILKESDPAHYDWNSLGSGVPQMKQALENIHSIAESLLK